MNVIQISPSYKPAYIYGGPIIAISALCQALAKSNTNVEVLTTNANGKENLVVSLRTAIEIDGINVHYFNRITKDHSNFSPTLLWHLYKKIKTVRNNASKENTIIHIHSWWNLVAMFSCVIAKLSYTPVVLSPRGMLTNYTLKNRHSFIKAIFHIAIGKRLIQYCHIHVTSHKEKKDILQLLQPRTITIIPNVVPIPQIIYLPALKNRKSLQLIFLSRVEEKKGLDILFEALCKVKFKWKLTIAGTGKIRYIQHLKNLAKRKKLDHAITWTGQIDGFEKFNMLRNHDLLVLPSHNENFANVVIESLAVGTPVAISHHVGLADYVAQRGLGWTADLQPAAFAKMLNNAYDSARKRAQIRTFAPEIIKKDFAEKDLLRRYNNLYTKVLKN